MGRVGLGVSRSDKQGSERGGGAKGPGNQDKLPQNPLSL